MLGNSTLKKADAELYPNRGKIKILGKEMEMKETDSGHYSVRIDPPDDDKQFVKENSSLECLVCDENVARELNLKEVEKLHQYFGHVSQQKLENLIKNANKMSPEVQSNLKKVYSNCQSCALNKKSNPRTKVALPRAVKFNDVVSIDLKDYKEGEHRYIVYMVDLFSRFTVGSLIPNKNPSTIGSVILEKWIAPMGRMRVLHSDRGGEFNNEELTVLAEYLGVRSTFTAAYSPQQNGVNERGHAIVDRMIDKIRTQDKSIPPGVALTWALVAKNTLQNVSGYSPFQIVFGECPSLPSVYTTGPSGLEEPVMSKAVAAHINALHLAREAYISGESDKILKNALKQRIYKRGGDIKQNEWIYFKNKDRWEGPVKVIALDGKNLYAFRGGRLLTINSDYAQIAAFEGELKKRSEGLAPGGAPLSGLAAGGAPLSGVSGRDASLSNQEDNPYEENVDQQENLHHIDAEIETLDEVAENNSQEEEGSNGNTQCQQIALTKNDVVRYKINANDDWVSVKLINRAGKVGGKHEGWWNVCDVEKGHKFSLNTNETQELEFVEDQPDSVADPQPTSSSEEVYVTILPRYRHNEKNCEVAKEKELRAWDNFHVYEEVIDEGQPKIGTNWILTQKVVDGKVVVKARLTARGDQEDSEGIRKDSPTVRKGNIKIFCMVAAKYKWNIKSSDVTSAFLQGVRIEREVYLLPPKERRIPGVLWKLVKPVYGLVDAPRGWHLSLDKKFQKAGCEKSLLDPAMYLHFTNQGGHKVLEGIALTHVDDILHGGSRDFEETVIQPIKKAFMFGTEEEEKFRYVGMNMQQTGAGISIDQNHYIEGLEFPDMDVVSSHDKNDEVMNSEGQAEFRSCVAKILHIGFQSRPDVCFEAKCLSTIYGKAKKSDLKSAYKKISKLKGQKTEMFFPNLGDIAEWTIVGYGDAGIKSMPDKLSSVGGHVVLLTNPHLRLACVLSWRSKKLVRKVVSSLAGEALATGATVGEIVYTKAILRQMFGEQVDKMPVIIFTDSRNLFEAVNSTSLVEDPWLIPDVAIIKEALENGTVQGLRRVASQDMIANCLTKQGASAESLLKILRTGQYILPAGI